MYYKKQNKKVCKIKDFIESQNNIRNDEDNDDDDDNE